MAPYYTDWKPTKLLLVYGRGDSKRCNKRCCIHQNRWTTWRTEGGLYTFIDNTIATVHDNYIDREHVTSCSLTNRHLNLHSTLDYYVQHHSPLGSYYTCVLGGISEATGDKGQGEERLQFSN